MNRKKLIADIKKLESKTGEERILAPRVVRSLERDFGIGIAKEAVQDALVKLIERSRAGLVDVENLEAYLLTAARNCAMEIQRGELGEFTDHDGEKKLRRRHTLATSEKDDTPGAVRIYVEDNTPPALIYHGAEPGTLGAQIERLEEELERTDKRTAEAKRIKAALAAMRMPDAADTLRELEDRAQRLDALIPRLTPDSVEREQAESELLQVADSIERVKHVQWILGKQKG